ncbi:MAG TPA: tripartite tricarboxylate transporter permease [Xanthobacteraceae bacterium]|nr:tripartite tricarboxylate transporter permease [Xanthobacteraceae bacterium]
MLDISALLSAFHLIETSAQAWIWIVPGLFVGLAFSAIPGVSISMAMAIVLPLSLYMDFIPAIVFLTSVYTGGVFGGSVPAILMNIPGSPSSYATTFDGYPMTLKGQHSEALGYALFSSTFCCMLGYVVLLLLIQPMASIVIKIGPLEMFAVGLWGLVLLGSLGSEYVSRGILAGTFGILLGTVGMNTAGFLRGTMGIPYLLDGISPIPAMIGLLAAGQLLTLVTKDYIVDAGSARKVSLRRILAGCWGTFKYPTVLLRGTLIGIVMGIIPGTGSAVANLISYAETKRTAKDSATFGQGNPKGVIGAEAAVASGEGGSMATMLTLGIPGHGAVAVLLAAFMMHNVVAGPSLIRQHKPVVYAIILNNILESIVLLGVGLVFIYAASYVVRLRTRYIVPVVLILAIMGTYSMDGTISGPITLFVFTIIGTVMVRYKYPVAATVVGLLLGRMLETQAIMSYQISGGSPSYILQRPGAMAIFAVMALSIGGGAWSRRRRKRADALVSVLPQDNTTPLPHATAH